MPVISKKKVAYPVSSYLRNYLRKFDREAQVPVLYSDLSRYEHSIPLHDSEGKDTLWETVFYSQNDMITIHENLKTIYGIMKTRGNLSLIEHLFVDRVDMCTYGNTKPFRVRIVNEINDNFDYFYVKHADASRIYGLELEHLTSPNRINYLVHKNTLVEEHIVGIPGDQFIKFYLQDPKMNEIRLAKEFVKFNERCFVRLLGDMHASNFVVDITPDFEEITYRLRAIDFDQQSYEGKKSVYMPQYFKQNNPIIEIGLRNMTYKTYLQYQQEERTLIANRMRSSKTEIRALLDAMSHDELSPASHVKQLRKELSRHYNTKSFMDCQNMGEIVRNSLRIVLGVSNSST
jgi:hypothetical protein